MFVGCNVNKYTAIYFIYKQRSSENISGESQEVGPKKHIFLIAKLLYDMISFLVPKENAFIRLPNHSFQFKQYFETRIFNKKILSLCSNCPHMKVSCTLEEGMMYNCTCKLYSRRNKITEIWELDHLKAVLSTFPNNADC